MKIELLPHETLCIEHEKYTAWPNFKAIGVEQVNGISQTRFVKDALSADDLACAAWRAAIPIEILKTLLSFPECHCELIAMAQAVPEIFIQLATQNPALAMMAATYWLYRPSAIIPEIKDRLIVWENLDPRELLHYTRCEPSRSFLKTLGKISASDCRAHVISELRALWQVPRMRRLLRHLPTIRNETVWLLGGHPPILDPGIHRLAANEPYFDEFNIGHIIADLSARRELKGWDHWPYRNQIHTWEQLLSAYDRFFRKTNHIVERFGEPPLAEVESEGLQIEALKSRTALEIEGRHMRNCIADYAYRISEGHYYAYRLLRPERATVLVEQRNRHWSVAEAMTADNAGEVQPETFGLLHRWTRPANN